MSFGWQCRKRLIKQVPWKPTEPRKIDDSVLPGPDYYVPPPIIGGKGFSKIKRAPRYSFGIKPPILHEKPAALPGAHIYNIRGLNKKGREHIPQGIIAKKCEPPGNKLEIPGPGAYVPKDLAQKKKPPAYSLRSAAKPPYEPWDMWTPSPNMYWPPIMKGRKAPAFSFGDPRKFSFDNKLPGPGDYTPNPEITKKAKPAFSFGNRTEIKTTSTTPAPNAYCEKQFFAGKKRAKAWSFGIKHSIYLGKKPEYLRPAHIDTITRT